jgi:hypothetical protein
MLAAALVWEEQFTALPADPAFWQRHAVNCVGVTGRHPTIATRSTLYAQRDAMRAASAQGPHCVAYRQSRERYFSMLVERALLEEKRASA